MTRKKATTPLKSLPEEEPLFVEEKSLVSTLIQRLNEFCALISFWEVFAFVYFWIGSSPLFSALYHILCATSRASAHDFSWPSQRVIRANWFFLAGVGTVLAFWIIQERRNKSGSNQNGHDDAMTEPVASATRDAKHGTPSINETEYPYNNGHQIPKRFVSRRKSY